MLPFLSGVSAKVSSCQPNTYSLFLSYCMVLCDTILVRGVNRSHWVRLSRMFQRKTQLVGSSCSSPFIGSLALIMDMGAESSYFPSTIKQWTIASQSFWVSRTMPALPTRVFIWYDHCLGVFCDIWSIQILTSINMIHWSPSSYLSPIPRFNTWPNCCFDFSKKDNIHQPSWNFLVNTKEVICHAGPFYPTLAQEEEPICVIKTLAFLFPLKKISWSEKWNPFFSFVTSSHAPCFLL